MTDDINAFRQSLDSGFAAMTAQAAQPITADEISRVEDPELLVDRVTLRLLTRYGWHEWPDADIAEVHRRWLAIDALESEWANGGLAQFVMNQGDAVEQVLAWAVDGYLMIGEREMAELARQLLRSVESEHAIRSDITTMPDARDRYDAYLARTQVTAFDDGVAPTPFSRASFVRTHPSNFVG